MKNAVYIAQLMPVARQVYSRIVVTVRKLDNVRVIVSVALASVIIIRRRKKKEFFFHLCSVTVRYKVETCT